MFIRLITHCVTSVQETFSSQGVGVWPGGCGLGGVAWGVCVPSLSSEVAMSMQELPETARVWRDMAAGGGLRGGGGPRVRTPRGV